MRIRSWMLMCAALGVVLIMSGVGMSKKQKSDLKVAIFLHAHVDSKDGTARALHALLYARELKEAGADVVLIFDGAGTTWVDKLRDPEHKFHKHYQQLRLCSDLPIGLLLRKEQHRLLVGNPEVL